MENEITSLARLGVIEKASPCLDQFLSGIFFTPKNDSRFRKVLNLKAFNEFVIYEHFEMESMFSVIDLMSKDCYFTNIDIMKAYYAVKIHPNHHKFLSFS